MSRKLSDTLSDVSVRYGHILQVICDWVDTTVMVTVCGRGTAKSTVIQARRIYRCVQLMPGAPLAIVANTYSTLFCHSGRIRARDILLERIGTVPGITG